MDAIKFVANYDSYLEEIRSVVKMELYPIIEELQQIDPHETIGPDTWFHSENDARGIVWGMFIKRDRVSTKG